MIKVLDEIEVKTKNYKEVVLTEEVVNRWVSLGFVRDSEEMYMNNLSLSYERLASYLVNEGGEEGFSDWTEIIAFPVTHIVVNELGDDIMPEKTVSVCEYYSKLFKDDVIEKISKHFMTNIDFEAELTRLIADSVLSKVVFSDKYRINKVNVDNNDEKCEFKCCAKSKLEPNIDIDLIEVGDYVGEYSDTLYRVNSVMQLFDAMTFEPTKVVCVDYNGVDRAFPADRIMHLYKSANRKPTFGEIRHEIELHQQVKKNIEKGNLV